MSTKFINRASVPIEPGEAIALDGHGGTGQDPTVIYLVPARLAPEPPDQDTYLTAQNTIGFTLSEAVNKSQFRIPPNGEAKLKEVAGNTLHFVPADSEFLKADYGSIERRVLTGSPELDDYIKGGRSEGENARITQETTHRNRVYDVRAIDYDPDTDVVTVELDLSKTDLIDARDFLKSPSGRFTQQGLAHLRINMDNHLHNAPKKPKPEVQDFFYCGDCGNPHIEWQVWYSINDMLTGETCSDETYCSRCEGSCTEERLDDIPSEQLEEYVKRAERWADAYWAKDIPGLEREQFQANAMAHKQREQELDAAFFKAVLGVEPGNTPHWKALMKLHQNQTSGPWAQRKNTAFKWTLVHGKRLNEKTGYYEPYAWLENQRKDLMYDVDRDHAVQNYEFERTRKINWAEDLHRYTYYEAMELAKKHGHAGPWPKEKS